LGKTKESRPLPGGAGKVSTGTDTAYIRGAGQPAGGKNRPKAEMTPKDDEKAKEELATKTQ